MFNQIKAQTVKKYIYDDGETKYYLYKWKEGIDTIHSLQTHENHEYESIAEYMGKLNNVTEYTEIVDKRYDEC